jgi:hypothetical protein
MQNRRDGGIGGLMAGTYSVNGANVTLKFEYTTTIAEALSIVGDCAEYLWNHGYGDHGTDEVPIRLVDLTDQDKVNLVDQHIVRVVVDCANTHKSQKAQDAAREAEELTKHSL